MHASQYVQRSKKDQLPSESAVSESKDVTSGNKSTIGRLFVLEASSGGQLLSLNTDGSNRKAIVSGCRLSDGIVVDADARHIYWTNMGNKPSGYPLPGDFNVVHFAKQLDHLYIISNG